MNEQQFKSFVKQTFDLSSTGYDLPELKFFRISAECMVALLHLQGGERIIDFCTGTGHVPLAAAPFLDRGSVTGVDISEGMIERAKKNAADAGLKNTDFVCSDMEIFSGNGRLYDIATCAFGIFFFPDMARALRKMGIFIRPGGKIVLSSFQIPFMEPQRGMLLEKLKNRYGTVLPQSPWESINTEEKFSFFLADKGFSSIQIEKKQCGYFLDSPEQWWNIIANTNMRNVLSSVQEHDLPAFKEEYLKDVRGLAKSGHGIWLEVQVLYASCTL